MKLFALILALVALAGQSFAAEWVPVVQVKSYTITGSSGPELYASIGEKGPLIGQTRTIALTNWDLKWSRKYVNEGSACVLKSAKPFLTVMYALPKPAAKLSGAAKQNWQHFIDGITSHEKVHGADIVTMVDEIIAETVGLRFENDAQCAAIRAEVLVRVKAANERYKAKSRVFDSAEMRDGGAVQQLVLRLVNGH
jgi:predicted secreted Zn-dependent protease